MIFQILCRLSLHRVILQSLAELSQFRDGIQELGVAGALNQYPNLLYGFFVNGNSQEDALTAGSSTYIRTCIYINMCILYVIATDT